MNPSTRPPKLVLLPGMDGTGALFADFVSALPAEFSAVVMNYPVNQDLSYSQLAKLVLNRAPQSEPFVLLAESFSTPVAIQIAAANPERVRALILCAGFAASPLTPLRRFIARIVVHLGIFPIPGKLVSEFLLIGRASSADLAKSLKTAISSVEPKVLAARLLAILSCDATQELSNVKVPILYIQAKHDRLMGPASWKQIREITPQAELVIIDGPHLILQREPIRSAEAVKKFLHRLLDPRHPKPNHP